MPVTVIVRAAAKLPWLDMRVLRLLTRANLGGPARQFRALIPAFAKLGVEETIVVGSMGPHESELSLEIGAAQICRLATMRGGFSPRQDRAALRELSAIVARVRPNVLHSHTAKAGYLAAKLARRTGLPLVHSFHGHVLRDYFSAPVTAFYRHLERRMGRERAALTCVSQSCAEELVELGVVPRDHWHLVEPAVASVRHYSRDAARQELDLSRCQAPCVAWCGRLEAVKDPQLLLRMLSCYCEQQGAAGKHGRAARQSLSPVPVQVCIFGTGSQARAIDAALGALPELIQVRMLGSEPRFPELLPAFDLLVATSRREGMPVSAIEALQAGVPVLAPRVPGFSDLAGEGLTLCAREPEALAAKLHQLLQSPSPPGPARQGQVRARHDPARIAQRYHAIYKKVQRK